MCAANPHPIGGHNLRLLPPPTSRHHHTDAALPRWREPGQTDCPRIVLSESKIRTRKQPICLSPEPLVICVQISDLLSDASSAAPGAGHLARGFEQPQVAFSLDTFFWRRKRKYPAAARKAACSSAAQGLHKTKGWPQDREGMRPTLRGRGKRWASFHSAQATSWSPYPRVRPHQRRPTPLARAGPNGLPQGLRRRFV